MKTKIRRISKRTLVCLMGITMLLFCIAVGQFTANATSNPVKGGFLIVKKPAGWSDVSLIAGGSWGFKNNFCKGFHGTNISGTDFYYISLSEVGNSSASTAGGWYLVDGNDTTNASGDSTWYVNVAANYSNRTGENTYGFNADQYYLAVPSGTGSNCSVTTTSAAGGSDYSKTIADNSSYKKSQIVKVALKAVGSSSYTEKTSSNTSTGGTVNLSGKQWDAWNTTKVASSSQSNYSSTLSNAVVTSGVTLTASAYSGYTFDGWNSAATGTGTSYTPGTGYTVSGAATTYARFSENANTVTFKQKLGEAAATTLTTKSAGVTTKASYTAATVSGYNFTGWTITSGSTNATNVTGTGSSTTTTVSLNAAGAVTVQANYAEAGTCGITAKKTNASGATLTTEAMTIGSNLTVYAAGNNFHTSGNNFSISTSNSSVAGISSNSVAKNGTFTVYAKSVGTATITISCAADIATTSFTVNVSKSDLAASFSTVDGRYVLNGDNTQIATATATPTISSKTWTSSNTSVATITNNGIVTPVAAGNTTLTVTATFANGGTDTASVDIKVEDPTLTTDENSLAMDYVSDTTNVGSDYKGTQTFSVTTNGNNPSYKPVTTITVESSNTSIVTVSPGTITSTGSTTVTATSVSVGTANIIVKFKINGTEVVSLRKTIAVTVSDYDYNMTIYASPQTNYTGTSGQDTGVWGGVNFIPSTGSGGTAMVKIGTDNSSKPVYALNITKKQFTDGFYFGQSTSISASGYRNTPKQTGTDITKNYYKITDANSGGAWHAGGSVAKSAVTITKPVISAKSNEDINIGASKSATAPVIYNGVTPSSYKWTTGTHSSYTANTTSATPTIKGDSVGADSATVLAFIPLVNTGVTFSSLETSSSSAYTYIASNEQQFTITVNNVQYTVTIVPVSRDTSSGTYSEKAAAMSTSSVSPNATVDYGTTATVSATASAGYVLTGYYTAANGGSQLSGTNHNQLTVADNTTVYARFEQKYTLTFTPNRCSVSGNGYSSNKLTTYAGTTPSTLTLSFDIGYTIDWNSSTNLSKYYNNPNSTTSSITLTPKSNSDISASDKVNKSVTIAAKKIDYTITKVVSPNTGTLKCYSDQTCNNEISTATYHQTFYAKYEPPSGSGYQVQSFAISGTGASYSSKNGNVGTFVMGSSNVTVTANVVLQYSVKYYIDMHDNNMSGKTVQVSVVTDSTGNTVKQDNSGNDCTGTLSKQGNSTVYASSVNTPLSESGSGYSALYIKVSYGTSSYVLNLATNQVSALETSKEIWLEAVNETSQDLKYTYSTEKTTNPEDGYRRIYLAKPYSWQNSEPNWKNIKIYHWGDYTDIGWNNGVSMTYLGYDGTGSSNYHYYYVDIPKTINSVKVKNIIFQGFADGASTASAQTGNIENIPDSANYYILSKDGNAYVGKKSTNDAVIPNYTRRTMSVQMNKGDTGRIVPTYTGADVTYTSSNTSKVTVNSSGVITANASTIDSNGDDSPVKITVQVRGTIGKKITSNSNNDDVLPYTVSVSVHDPSKFNRFNIMSVESQNYTVDIPTQSGNQPGYFDMNGVEMEVTGLLGVSSSKSSAIVTQDSTVTVDGVVKPKSFKIKYAASSIYFSGYDGIQITGKITTKSIRRTGGQRYGFDHWSLDGTTPSSSTYIPTKTIDNAVETAVTTGIPFQDIISTYSAEFASYAYVDVTFVYDYYEYKPEVAENGQLKYPYDATYAGTEDRTSDSFKKSSHTLKTHTVSDYEVRNYNATTIQPSDLTGFATQAIKEKPTNNYYDYQITASTIEVVSRDASTYTAIVNVHMTHSVKHYSVYLNGSLFETGLTYQAYSEPSVQNSSKWYAYVDNVKGPLLATGKSYKFRVKGDTDLRTEDGSVSNGDFNRSEVGFSHNEITHENNKEYLLQNFYIADFFDKNKAYDPDSDPTNTGTLLPYEDASFVGGGVVYYSVKNDTPNSRTVDGGYVNGTTGAANEEEIKDLIRAKIESTYDSDKLADELGEEDAMKVAYGTEHEAAQVEVDGVKTGIIFRYKPFETYIRDTTGANAGNIQKDNNGKYTMATTLNDDTFRYSNSLQAYQYIYASGNENIATNEGRNMRLYSYYVYSYLTYNKDTSVPEIKYDILLSDRYSDASTYWNGTNN